jgi:zinc transport system substrate-binding protein
VSRDLVAETAFHAADRALETSVFEGLDLAAVVADEVMMMRAVRVRRLVPRDALSEIDSLDVAALDEHVERSVDTRNADSTTAVAQRVEDLVRRDAARLLAEDLHDGSAGAAASITGALKRRPSLCRPAHRRIISALRTRMTIITAVRITTLLVAATALTIASGCSTATQGGAARTSVVAAFYPLAYAAEQIGGDGVRVEDLTPAGAEPHDIELAPSDVAHIDAADVFLYVGGGFQPAVEQAARDASGRKVDVLTTALHQNGDDGTDQGIDPHVWLDPTLYARVARVVGRTLHRNSTAFRRRLALLDRDYRRGLASCRRHELVTSHAAFGRLAARYGLDQVAISGRQPEAEPSARRLAELSHLVERHGVTTVFVEPLVSPKVADAVAREAGVKTAVLNPIEGLTKEQQAAGENYFSLMRENLAALRHALGCR